MSKRINRTCIGSFLYPGKRLLFILLINFCINQISIAQTSLTDVPMIGAEIFIEPGQKPEEIDTWFRLMKEAGMTLTRIRLFESYMHKEDGSWDYSLFDAAYKAGEKYGIRIYGNLFPATSFTDVGGFKFPRDEAHLKSIAEYIKNLVTHFKQFKSSYGWVPINEPGSGGLPKDNFTNKKYQEWKTKQSVPIYNSNGYQHFDFADERFLIDYNIWFLKWLTDEIQKYDPGSPIHVNNHAIFQNAAEYNFPEWRKFLTSLGGSAHASWHFGYFNRSQYAMALSANSEMLRSGAGNIPWLMTELQGGNNTYSGYNAMCPTKEEIAQWLWTTIGAESKGNIFWSLNPRASGTEAGEWALLNFQNEPSDRMKEAANVAKTINRNPNLFAHAKEVESGINILYVREALWVEKKLQTGGTPYEGRNVGGVMKSALGYFEAISEMGLQSNFKEIGEFDFSQTNYTGKVIILAHQIAIPSKYWKPLEDFVSKGGKLIADGLTGFYDENALSIMKTGFPLEKLFGGNIKEFKVIDNLFTLRLINPKLDLPAHLWRGTIAATTARPISTNEAETVAVRNNFGKGEVIWMPSLVGLGARINKNYKNLGIFLKTIVQPNVDASPFSFVNTQEGMLMKTLQSNSSYITIILNKSGINKSVVLKVKEKNHNPKVLFANKKGNIKNNIVAIASEETIVIQW
jgi:beta-galactosidase